MSFGHEHHGDHAHHEPRTLPATLAAPPVLAAWRMRALIASAGLAILSFVLFSWTHEGRNHLLRAYLDGFMMCFNLAGGGLCMLMLQHVTGGKWGLLLRRPLEAMSRTLPLVALLFVPIMIPFFGRHLYQWIQYTTPGAVNDAWLQGAITQEQALCINFKRPFLNPSMLVVESCGIFAILLFFMYRLNRLSVQQEADPERGTDVSYERWRVKFENLSGPGILIYVALLTVGAIVWIKALDVTWYSSIWGLQFLVAQGYAVLAFGILSLILLSRFEPIRTVMRTTEQHDLGKLAFAFVMLNIYLTFAEFLIIWSGNLPDEIPWYLHRIRGGWWVICSLDFICHWLIPFVILLSRDIKRNKSKMIWVCCWMLFARLVDMFWIVEPNFRGAAGNLVNEPLSTFAYLTVPLAVMSLWAAYYMHNLMQRPLVVVNDPHLEEMLEPEHAH